MKLLLLEVGEAQGEARRHKSAKEKLIILCVVKAQVIYMHCLCIPTARVQTEHA